MLCALCSACRLKEQAKEKRVREMKRDTTNLTAYALLFLAAVQFPGVLGLCSLPSLPLHIARIVCPATGKRFDVVNNVART
jgi:hypothetical protein